MTFPHYFGDYRITETFVPTRVEGVLTEAVRYYACVRVTAGDRKLWAFAGKKEPYRTFESAKKACVRHAKIWERLVRLAAASGHRLKRLEAIVRSTRPKKTKWWRRKIRTRRYLNASPLDWPPASLSLDASFLKLLARARSNVLSAEKKSASVATSRGKDSTAP